MKLKNSSKKPGKPNLKSKIFKKYLPITAGILALGIMFLCEEKRKPVQTKKPVKIQTASNKKPKELYIYKFSGSHAIRGTAGPIITQ